VVNLAGGIWLALTQPSRASDVWMIYDWCRGWLLHGQELYVDSRATTDYPPNAIVVLAPLALVSRAWLVPLWTAMTLAVSPLLSYLVVRSICPRTRPAAALLPTVLFLCWGGARTLLESSRFSMTLGFLALVFADTRPLASGVALGLALAKPHIAGPVMLWALVTGRLRVAAVAVTVVASGFAVYCARAHVGPVDVISGYAGILVSFYSGANALVGRTSLRPWWIALAGGPARGDILWAAGAILLLIVPCQIARRDKEVADASAAATALFCLWSLLTIYHIGNNLILLLPAFAFLLLVDDPVTLRWRLAVVSAIQIAMMLDVPVHLASRAADRGPLTLIVRDFDRIVVLVAFVSVTMVWRRLERGRSAVQR